MLAAGYAPAIGFLHTGKPLSFVYDIADLFKFETAIPAAFKAVARQAQPIEREVRLACRDMFRESSLLRKIIPVIEDILAAGGVEKPKAAPEAMPMALPNTKGLGDAGHRN